MNLFSEWLDLAYLARLAARQTQPIPKDKHDQQSQQSRYHEQVARDDEAGQLHQARLLYEMLLALRLLAAHRSTAAASSFFHAILHHGNVIHLSAVKVRASAVKVKCLPELAEAAFIHVVVLIRPRI